MAWHCCDRVDGSLRRPSGVFCSILPLKRKRGLDKGADSSKAEVREEVTLKVEVGMGETTSSE